MVQSTVKIVGFNPEGENICAGAARISTTEGNALEIFEKSADQEKNRSLIGKVLGSGHTSILEHSVFNLAFCNVSAVVEEFVIEFRLASFTVKSRRYVNFEKMGYYIPESLHGEAKEQYVSHIDSLFQTYGELIKNGIPKEDARFVLPYCFFSNFYCTVNARELIYMIRSMQERETPDEIKNLASQLIHQLEEICPSVAVQAVKKTEGGAFQPESERPEEKGMEEVTTGCQLIDFSGNPEKNLLLAYRIKHPNSRETDQAIIMERIQREERDRELEQIFATFVIRNLSLSGITHIVRHRMQSILIPSLRNVDIGKYIVPDSVREKPELYQAYQAVFEKNAKVLAELARMGFTEREYLNLSGNTLDIMTTMNGRELKLFFELRCCERAQWEIRKAAVDLLDRLKEKSRIFDSMGPGCVSRHKCREGRLSCGKMAEVVKRFTGKEKTV